MFTLISAVMFIGLLFAGLRGWVVLDWTQIQSDYQKVKDWIWTKEEEKK